jgi:hypothetical protein
LLTTGSIRHIFSVNYTITAHNSGVLVSRATNLPDGRKVYVQLLYLYPASIPAERFPNAPPNARPERWWQYFHNKHSKNKKMKLELSVIALGLITFIACKKDCPTTPAVKTQEQLLTAKTWKADEIRIQLSNGTSQYYKRGGGANTVNYDSDSLKFNTNNTGTYYYLGIQYTTTWNFINSEKSKMTLIINYPTPVTVNLENVTLAETYFSYSQYVTSGISYLASGRRLPN